MFGLGVQELLIIFLIILVFFGAEKIPQLAKSIGKGMAEFRKASQEVKEAFGNEVEAEANTDANTSPAAGTIEEPTPTLNYIPCNACQGNNPIEAIYCSQCGKRLSQETCCTTCQRTLSLNEKFCPNCGNPRPI